MNLKNVRLRIVSDLAAVSGVTSVPETVPLSTVPIDKLPCFTVYFAGFRQSFRAAAAGVLTDNWWRFRIDLEVPVTGAEATGVELMETLMVGMLNALRADGTLNGLVEEATPEDGPDPEMVIDGRTQAVIRLHKHFYLWAHTEESTA